jgi:hypothetical protein
LSGRSAGPGVALYHINLLNEDTLIFSLYAQHFADLTFVLAGNDFNLVVFLNFAFFM